jgi:hypothetical protein
MELWEHSDSRVDQLILQASREEVEAGNISCSLLSLEKLLKPENVKRLRGKLIFCVNGYKSDPRELHQIPEVRAWMQELDRHFPHWFYFMDTGLQSTLGFVAFSLCTYEKVPEGSVIPPQELQRFLTSHYETMNILSRELGESQEENDARSKEIAQFFAAGPARQTH